MKSSGNVTRQPQIGQSWFAMAVHILALLARSPEGYPSAYLAGSVNTHAVFLRKVVAHLVRAGLVVAQEGREGGYRLARPADQISLADVYRVMYAGGPLPPNPAEPNPLCEVGSGMRAALGEVASEVEQQMVRDLERHTIAEISDRAVLLGNFPNGR
ncbi:MAG TPA: Rrf2 family transcriptional regulator [Chloroflexota bacterium]|nr:Rrf2 family transcriptional regulator [Chloroflexota bacterium]